MLEWSSSISARPVCSYQGSRIKDTARSFALKAEESVQRDSMGFGDIRALCPKLSWFYIALDGVIRGGRRQRGSY